MLCISACPVGGFEINPKEFYFLLSKLKKSPQPVLGCNVRQNVEAHAASFCLGFLSEEHLIALMVVLNKPLQINLTECNSCKNSFIVDVLKKRLKSVEEKLFSTQAKACDYPLLPTPYTLTNISLVEDKASLQFQDIPCDRRGFFNIVKSLTMESAATFFESAAEQEKKQFSEKLLPSRQQLLNKIYSAVSEKSVKDRIKNYYYDVEVADSCDMCFACVGMCPTGALKSHYETNNRESNQSEDSEKQELFFYSVLCVGCGLCSEFCMNSLINIKQGFSGDNPFRIKCVRRVMLDEEDHDTIDEEEQEIAGNDK